MSNAEYFSKPFPLVAKLASMLRNNAAVQFVVARLARLLRSNKSSDEPLVSAFLGEIPSLGEEPSLGEKPSLDEKPSLGETPDLDETPSVGETPSLDEIPDLEPPNPGEIPGAANAGLFFTAPQIFGESTTAAQSDQSERETLIRRRWAETGIKMWNPDIQGAGQAALTIQGSADLLPVKPGATRREYDRLEFKLIEGQIACEGVVVDPPARRK